MLHLYIPNLPMLRLYMLHQLMFSQAVISAKPITQEVRTDATHLVNALGEELALLLGGVQARADVELFVIRTII